ncbi:hypothetical protein AXF42_Ash015770 [Apostasia shenzhenica]|uniref:Cystatin domain-containing protein n=1 Tax=Apostasia shenzhenica TaxID=1088818 RepID=A0A2H9ZXK9_9ASPA|nr:hypothetical protein AXF42_Ash015770 [Apostasia shenzhenica]
MPSAGHLLLFLLAAAAGGEALGQSGNQENPISYDRLQSMGLSAVEQYNRGLLFCLTAEGHKDVAGGFFLLRIVAKDPKMVAPVVYAVRVHPDGVLRSFGYEEKYIPIRPITCPK